MSVNQKLADELVAAIEPLIGHLAKIERRLAALEAAAAEPEKAPPHVEHREHRGLFKPGQKYAAGDTVSYLGGSYTALRDTDELPITSCWRRLG